MIDEERVRQLAYSIWEAEGRPEGQQQQHWERARKIVAAEQHAESDAQDELLAPLDEPPIMEEDLPLEEDERGIEESRLPLDEPEDDLDASPSQDEARLTEVTDDLPVQDRGHAPGVEPVPAPERARVSAGAQKSDQARATPPAKKAAPRKRSHKTEK
ncbi:DUF2934 domain-containing protein [Vreelandella sp. TE19]